MRANLVVAIALALAACTPRSRAAPPRSGYIQAPDPPATVTPTAKPGLPPLPGITTLKGTLDGRPFAARSAILVALNTITQEATINVTEYETTCDAGAKFADGSTTVQLTVQWKAGPRDPKDRKPTALFGVRRDGTWKMRSVFDVGVDVLSAPPGTGPSALGRIHVKASRDEENIEGDIDVLPCEK